MGFKGLGFKVFWLLGDRKARPGLGLRVGNLEFEVGGMVFWAVEFGAWGIGV